MICAAKAIAQRYAASEALAGSTSKLGHFAKKTELEKNQTNTDTPNLDS